MVNAVCTEGGMADFEKVSYYIDGGRDGKKRREESTHWVFDRSPEIVRARGE